MDNWEPRVNGIEVPMVGARLQISRVQYGDGRVVLYLSYYSGDWVYIFVVEVLQAYIQGLVF